MNDALQVIKNFFIETDPKIFVALGAGLAVLIFELILTHRNLGKKNREKRLKDLKSSGHLVKAQRVSQWKDGDKSEVNDYVHATYTYVVNGVKYRFRYLYRQVPPLIITLYYKNNPANARWTETMFQEKGIVSVVKLLMPVIVAAVVFFLCKKIGV